MRKWTPLVLGPEHPVVLGFARPGGLASCLDKDRSFWLMHFTVLEWWLHFSWNKAASLGGVIKEMNYLNVFLEVLSHWYDFFSYNVIWKKSNQLNLLPLNTLMYNLNNIFQTICLCPLDLLKDLTKYASCRRMMTPFVNKKLTIGRYFQPCPSKMLL